MGRPPASPEADAKPCTGCGEEPRIPNQRYGANCHAAAQRRWRAIRQLSLTDAELDLIRALRATGAAGPSLSSPRWPPAGPSSPVLGGNDGIAVYGSNHAPGCLGLAQQRDFGDPWGIVGDLIHVCDWPVLRAAVNAWQAAREATA
jgi:hypothetical protein